jgi:hypothetical protein
MNIQVNDFRWKPGKNDAEYIKLLESSRDEWQKIAQKAIAKLKAQEPISDQDRKDLDILHRVKEGKLAKSLCFDYVIYNGEWYRNHKWDWPNDEPLEPRIVDGEPECGMCLYELRRDADNYCPCCGRKIKWE